MASRRSWVRIPSAPPSFQTMPFYVYILRSETTGRFYVGQTERLVETGGERFTRRDATVPKREKEERGANDRRDARRIRPASLTVSSWKLLQSFSDSRRLAQLKLGCP